MIRPAAAADVPAIAELERTSLGHDAWSRPLVEDGVTGGLPTICYLVAEVEGTVVGYAATSIVAEIAELQRIAVDPGRRRGGIATEILAAVVDQAAGAGADRLLLEVREGNAAARAFYAARHFVEVDRRLRYYRDGGTAIVMRRSLVTGPG